MSNRNIHRPRHIYADEKFYFITSRTYKEFNYFNTDVNKNLLIRTLNEAKEFLKIPIYAWVILNNHYHFLLYIDDKNKLAKFNKHIKGKSSFLLNKLENKKGRKIWYQYWDHCIRDEADFYRHFNYIHNNPIKHKEVRNIEELHLYKYSSFNTWIKKKGREWLNSSLEDYPILDFTVEED